MGEKFDRKSSGREMMGLGVAGRFQTHFGGRLDEVHSMLDEGRESKGEGWSLGFYFEHLWVQ